MRNGGAPSERSVAPGDQGGRRGGGELHLDALPEHMASPVFKSFARSAAVAAAREIAHKLFRKTP